MKDSESVGLVSNGLYLPFWRLSRSELPSGRGKGNKAVAGPDEDSITMAVAAAIEGLQGINREEVGALLFASTTSSYGEKEGAALIGRALDLAPSIFTSDLAHCLRAGTHGIKLATDLVKAGSASHVMVTSADCRLASPGSELEPRIGDGAAAWLVGRENLVASLQGSYFLTQEIMDVWHAKGETYLRSWEDRFITSQGYLKAMQQAITTFLNNQQISPSRISKVVLSGPDDRRIVQLARMLKFSPSQLQSSFFEEVGITGSAHPLILLAAALAEASKGDLILLASYGNGVDVLLFQAEEQVDRMKPRAGLASYLKPFQPVEDYYTYLKWRELVEISPPIHPFLPSDPSASALWREQEQILPFKAGRCSHCGYIQYPPQRVCTSCHHKGDMESVRLSDKQGSIYTYAFDSLTNILTAVVDLEGGGRILGMMTDCDPKAVRVGMEVKLTFRKVLVAQGIHNYYWKIVPIQAGGGEPCRE